MFGNSKKVKGKKKEKAQQQQFWRNTTYTNSQPTSPPATTSRIPLQTLTAIVSKLQSTVGGCVTTAPSPFFRCFLGQAPIAEDDSPQCDSHCRSCLKAPPPPRG